MKTVLAVVCVLVALGFPNRASGQKIRKETIESQGKKRVYYLVVPDQATAEHPAPLLLLLHGSGRNGLSLIDKWKDLAIKEGIVLVGPDAINSQGWNSPADGPDFLHDLMDMAIQHRDRAEAAQLRQQLIRIAGAPSPGLVHSP